MDGRTELNQRVWAWLHRRRMSRRQLALQSKVGESTLLRMLEDESYTTAPDNWRKLAQFLKWDESEVLALAGYAVPVSGAAESLDTTLTQALARAGYSETDITIIMELVHRLAPAAVPSNAS